MPRRGDDCVPNSPASGSGFNPGIFAGLLGYQSGDVRARKPPNVDAIVFGLADLTDLFHAAASENQEERNKCDEFAIHATFLLLWFTSPPGPISRIP